MVCGFCSFWGPAVESWTVYVTIGFWFVVFDCWFVVCGFCAFWGPAVETWTVYVTVCFWLVVLVPFRGRLLKPGLYTSLFVCGLWFLFILGASC